MERAAYDYLYWLMILIVWVLQGIIYFICTGCEHLIRIPLLTFWILCALFSLAYLLGKCFRKRWLYWLSLLTIFVFILIFFIFAIFMFAVTNKANGEAIVGKGYKHYKLSDYSNWMQHAVNRGNNWKAVRDSLQQSDLIQKMANVDGATVDEFYKNHLSDLQSGCCKPPDECGFVYQNPISWKKPNNASNVVGDCNSWDNNPKVFCYNCESCKAGFLNSMNKNWKLVGLFNIVALVCMVIAYFFTCRAFLRDINEDRDCANAITAV